MSSLSSLKEKFDKVLIRYTDNSCEVLLTKGLNVYKGISKCHENDNFNRKLGRTIALGRAEFVSGETNSRKDLFADGTAKFSKKRVMDTKELDQCINNFLPKKRKA